MSPTELFHKIVDFITSDDPITRFCIIAIAGLLLALWMKKLLIYPIRPDMKKFGRDVYGNAKRTYLTICWVGWVFIFFGIASIELGILQIAVMSKKIPYEVGVLGGILLIFSGVLINFRNFVRVYLSALREKLN